MGLRSCATGWGGATPQPARLEHPLNDPVTRGTASTGAIHGKHFGAPIRALVIVALFTLLFPLAALSADGWSEDTGALVYSVAASADGSLIVTGRRDNMVVAYDAAGQQRWSFATQGTVYGVAVSHDGQRIAVASEDRHVYLLDGAGAELWRFRGTQTFLSVSITGDGSTIVGGSEDNTVSLFDATGNLAWQYTAGDHVVQVALYGDKRGFRVVAGSRDSRVALLSGDGELLWQSTLNYSVRSLAVTPNGATIVVGDDRSTLYALDGGSGDVLWEASLGSSVAAVGINQDGNLIVAGSAGGSFATFDAEGNQTQQVEVDGSFADLSLTSDGDAAIAVDEQVAIYPRGDDGAFQVPEKPSRFWDFAIPALVVLAIVALIATLLGLRRQADGQRSWRGFANRRRVLAREVWRARLSYCFLLPTIALLLLFNYYPAFSGIYHAFTEWTPGGETNWVGLGQFEELKDNRYFWTGIGNLLILIVTGFLKLLIPLAVAEMIFHLRSSRIRYAFRTLFVLQVIVPGVVGILLWVNVYDPNIGLANQLLRAAGLESFARFWLGDADTAIWAIVFMGFPWVSAFALLIFYGGLISIPGELFDSAALDGASTLRRIINIDLPLLVSQFRLLLILTFIAMVQEFSAIFLTTGGGPGSSTYVPSLELYYQAVRFNNFGAASAIGAVLFIVILGGTILNLKYVKSSVEYSA